MDIWLRETVKLTDDSNVLIHMGTGDADPSGLDPGTVHHGLPGRGGELQIAVVPAEPVADDGDVGVLGHVVPLVLSRTDESEPLSGRTRPP